MNIVIDEYAMKIKLTDIDNLYFVSDIHMGHNKDFLYKPRGFNSIAEHDEGIIKNWNDLINDEDVVIVLGDSLMGNQDEGIEKLKQLKGKIYFICGNHDTSAKAKRYIDELGWTYLGYSLPITVNKYHFIVSHYPTCCSNYDAEKPLTQRTINLCGHVHTQDRFADINKGLCYHVDLDAHSATPVSFREIISDILSIC